MEDKLTNVCKSKTSLQTPPIGYEVGSLTYELESKSITQEELKNEIEHILKSFLNNKTLCDSMVKEYRDSRPAHLPDDGIDKILQKSNSLIEDYTDLALASSHPRANEASRKSFYDIHNLLWSVVHSMWELSEQYHHPHRDHSIAFFHTLFSTIQVFYEYLKDREIQWALYLGHIGRFMCSLTEGTYQDQWRLAAYTWYEKTTYHDGPSWEPYYWMATISKSGSDLDIYFLCRSIGDHKCPTGGRDAASSLLEKALSREIGSSIGHKALELMSRRLKHLMSEDDIGTDHVFGQRCSCIGATVLTSLDLASLNASFRAVFTKPSSSGIDVIQEEPFKESWLKFFDILLSTMKASNKTFHRITYMILVFMYNLAIAHNSHHFFFNLAPWNKIAEYLNNLKEERTISTLAAAFGSHPPLPEDYYIRGQYYCSSVTLTYE